MHESSEMDPIRLAVVFATDFDQVSPGGTTSGLRVLARHLSDRFRLALAGAGEDGNFQPMQRHLEGREITVIPVVPSRWRPAWLPLNILFVARLFRARHVVLSNADIVNPRRMESAIPFVLRKTKPIILTIHSSSKYHPMVRHGLFRLALVRAVYRLAERFVLSRVDRVLLICEEDYAYYVSRYPWLRAKFTVIQNSVDLSFFSPIERSSARKLYDLNTSDLVVAYCGRLSGEKRLGILLEAFAEVVRRRPSAHLLIGGDGPEMASLREKATSLGLSNVRFLGMLSRNNVRELLSCADVFVLPSSYEGLPNAVLEALACGVPVVAADVGGVREILSGELEPFVLKRLDPRSLAEKILEAAQRGPEIGPLCIKRAQDFDATRIVPKLEAMYLDVLRSATSGDGSGHRH